MPSIWRYFKQLFREAEQSTPANPAVHEWITRSEEEKADYEHWKNTLDKRRLTDWLNDQYATYQVLPQETDEAIDFLDTPSSKGFVVYFLKTGYSKEETGYLFDYLKEQVLKLGYKTQLSDTRTYNRPDWVETVERHYLKPRKGLKKEEKIDQLFGNITIEREFRDENIHNLRLSATAYNDRLYAPPQPFKELMQGILTE